MMKTYDVAIVGSGPAGLASASILASQGMKVALIDRCAFPREKLCGGLLSGRTKRAVEEIYGPAWGPGIECTANGVRVLHLGRLLASVETPHTVYLASRAAFDAHLFSLTAEQGPDILQGDPVESVDPGAMTVRFRNGTALKADFIIGADGVTSRVARSLFPGPFRKQDYALCFQAELPRGDVPDFADVPEIHFGHVRWGYAWVFPKKETLSVGLGGMLRKNGAMKGLFEQFHTQVAGREPATVKSHYIPSGNFRPRPGMKAVLLAGDAAGLVEPITGEGIAYALLSGKHAAHAVLQASREGAPHRAYAHYRARYRGMVRAFLWAKVLRPLMSSRYAEPRFIRELPNASGLIEMYMALISGETDYGHLVRPVFAKMAGDILAMLNPIRSPR
jgi:menaquinone-9 beta-reductase